ncbi:MAG: DEAD/DEAH box helicase [Deltaproteobacteria bacterium]|nr:DEAD/DEAH box helicase [Deltaproteobacteria bacterium]MBW2246387.1 DEAD/DEAH box helicase [Deltaproteobacteria bacterium]MBW2597215.1 DEAD/DEAH box helicase [Deltaproteobacteria bacterium]MBW2638829.1 DEAD/DEAH box helicase [Deltaproteobacteria bacterium]MBW2679897.1 DEAD/DEAH box helicase [Deltaproteobacteria bacterium]
MNFSSFGLKHEIIRAIDQLGFEHATRIQEKVIPRMLTGDTDVIGLAQTGTGKTAAYGLPLIHLLDFKSKNSQGLILCPTRELCLQITSDLKLFARHIPNARIAAVYGGADIRKQITLIKKGAQIIVATPGRLLDLINRKAVKLGTVAYAVLDEADEMLNMGFQEDIDDILKRTPTDKRTCLFSATMPDAAAKIADTYMIRPKTITAGSPNKAAENISHACYVVKEKNRYSALKRMIDYIPDIFGLIFCRTRIETQTVADKLMKDGYNAEPLHGDLSQMQRNQVMKKFRERTLQLLVATDVAARGLDVHDITHVINYNLPDEPDRYTHRSGRTARAGKSGVSIVLVNTREVRRIKELESKSGIRFEYKKIPGGRAVCEKQLYAMVDRLVSTEVNKKEIDNYLPPVFETLSALSKEELIRRFVSAEFNRFLDYYRGAEDINVSVKKRQTKADKAEHRLAGNTQRFFMNVGRLDKLKEGAIVRLVCDKSGISSKKLGRIQLKREFSFFDVEKSVAKKVLKSLKGVTLDGRKIRAKFSD